MKKPDLKDLKQSAPTAPAAKPDNSKSIRKTYSLNQEHLDRINKTAVEMGQSSGTIVNASEALRFIIDQHGGES